MYEKVDVEWIELMLQASEIGLTVEEVTAFLNDNKKKV
ncbi:DNA-binding anti-repressor SinI [Aquibacillus halophilus]|uniref:DNA-binding anti-repressor SinI n=1 Tax=Aquibacillus halophilus TaxID=930132 RepID=A0A6A8DFX0_9BACI|nr:DNA-binding anti-repressor SinI [Aquibacillus halophilus]